MSDGTAWLHLTALASALASFIFLVLANEREEEKLLCRAPSQRECRARRAVGWLMLALAMRAIPFGGLCRSSG